MTDKNCYICGNTAAPIREEHALKMVYMGRSKIEELRLDALCWDCRREIKECVTRLIKKHEELAKKEAETKVKKTRQRSLTDKERRKILKEDCDPYLSLIISDDGKFKSTRMSIKGWESLRDKLDFGRTETCMFWVKNEIEKGEISQ